MPLLAVLGNGRKRVLAAHARRNRCCPNPSRCRHNGRPWYEPHPSAQDPSTALATREILARRRDAIQKFYPGFSLELPSEDALMDRRVSSNVLIKALKKVQRAEKLIERLKALKNSRHHRNSVLPMIAGGVAAGVAGAVANRLLKNPSKSVRGYRVPPGSEARIVKALADNFVWARAEDGIVVTLATPSFMAAVMSRVFGGRKVSVSKARRNSISNGLLMGVASDGTKYVVKKDREWNEWQVVAYVGGKRHEGKTYHASDKADAVGTFHKLVAKRIGHVEIGGPDIISFDMGGGVRFNRKRRVRRNPGAGQDVIAVPFRQGRKYSVSQVQNWVERHGTPEMKQRFAQAMAQYRRFHKGSLPKYITYSLYKMGSHQGISDVEFGVSEGREWMAAYQVPRSSGKWMDKASGGRYVHAHGDSDIEVDIKRPVKLSKLPLRFHTPDGKAVGVIPSKNVKIGEWYEG